MYNRLHTEEWDFKNANTKEFTHGYHSYPAMMIPQIARKLITEFAPSGRMELLFDPYMGSGTSLVEASLKGINSIGTDLNPLARLISEVKSRHYSIRTVEEIFSSIQAKFLAYSPIDVIDTDFSHITKHEFWYSEDSLFKLSFITQIVEDIDISIKNFFKLALAEVIREVSFTRNGEFKRYKMSEQQLIKFNPDVFTLFQNKIIRNIKGLREYNNIPIKGNVQIFDFNTSEKIPSEIFGNDEVDIVVTSPPYGDSKTTVAYGQFSRWANEWFQFPNAKVLDSLLMGGKPSKEAFFTTKSIYKELETIKLIDSKRYYDVISFLNDYYASICNVAKVVRKGGKVCYVVGNRNVKGVQIPLDFFTAEMFEKNGFKHEFTIVRTIPNKKMPSKNSPTNEKGVLVDTMTSEYIVILEKK